MPSLCASHRRSANFARGAAPDGRTLAAKYPNVSGSLRTVADHLAHHAGAGSRSGLAAPMLPRRRSSHRGRARRRKSAEAVENRAAAPVAAVIARGQHRMGLRAHPGQPPTQACAFISGERQTCSVEWHPRRGGGRGWVLLFGLIDGTAGIGPPRRRRARGEREMALLPCERARTYSG